MFDNVKHVKRIPLYLREGNRKHQKYVTKSFIAIKEKDLVSGRECCRCKFQHREEYNSQGSIAYYCSLGGFTIQTHGSCKRFKKGIELNNRTKKMHA